MNDGSQTQESGNAQPQSADSGLKELEKKVNYFQEEIRKISTQRDELKAQLKKIDEDDAKKKGDFEKLLADKTVELDTLKTERESLKKTVERLENYEKERRKELLEKLKDEKHKKIASDLPLDKLELFVELETVSKKPDTDDGNAGGKSVKLTPTEKLEADRMGLTEKEYSDLQATRRENKEKNKERKHLIF